VSLLLVSAGVALAAGIPVAKIVQQMETGMGAVLAHVAPIVGLGAMLGKLLEVSGGAEKIADRLLRLFGEKRAPATTHQSSKCYAVPDPTKEPHRSGRVARSE
jgi:GntP family gluconate:H+ symporter